MRAFKQHGSQAADKERRVGTLDSITRESLEHALDTVRRHFDVTPCRRIGLHGATGHCIVKDEAATPTGSFKARGAINFVSKAVEMGVEVEEIVAASTGNHGIGLAWAGGLFKKRVSVVLPESAPSWKKEKLEKFGAKVSIFGTNLDEAIRCARERAQHSSRIFVPSFNPQVIVGNASLGVELFRAYRGLKRVFFPIGVGAGIAGLVLAREMLSPETRIVGVVPSNANAWALSSKNGKPTPSIPGATLADGLRTVLPDADMFRFLMPRLEGVVPVSEMEIQHAVRLLTDTFGRCPEPTGAVGLAGVHAEVKRGLTSLEGVATVICG
jgi:threonine dehydratase